MLLLLTLDVVRVFLRVIQPSTSSPVMSILIGDEGIIISTSAGGESGTVPLEDLPDGMNDIERYEFENHKILIGLLEVHIMCSAYLSCLRSFGLC